MTADNPIPAVPNLRFPEFRNTSGWSIEPLGHLFTERQETGFSDLPLLSVTDREGVIPQEETNRKNNSNSNKEKYLRVVPGDIAYNTMRMWEGRSALVGMEGVVSPAYTVCQPRVNTNSDFFGYYFKTNTLIKQFRKYSQGLVKDTLNLKYEAFSGIPVGFPSPREQQKIADCLGSLDQLIAAECRKLEGLRQHKQGLMQQLFPLPGETVPRLRFPEFADAPEWREETLGNMVAIMSGKSPSQYTLLSKGDCAFVKVEDLNNCIKYQVHGREYCNDGRDAVPIGSILFPKRGASIENNKIRITASAVLIDTNLMALKPHNRAATEFLYYYIVRVGLAQIADTSSIPQINNKHIIPYRVLIPCDELEQKRIGDFLSIADASLSAQAQKVTALKAHKQGLLQQLFPSLEGNEQ
ncbi:restriction endonuclease subunit S [Bradyrhizobium ottawaense]|uniref:restriction endonuclease subunit S n=1 Tax=Bradyrhizobium ottawaense TaxID=931866 RepID=UPI0027D5E625|nr:restriction endonuclease subunit S [Bradyrhizobium ottawaense]GMO87655.1 restriction endonuclease subunit S [Bradyrhizobium ottawaense]